MSTHRLHRWLDAHVSPAPQVPQVESVRLRPQASVTEKPEPQS